MSDLPAPDVWALPPAGSDGLPGATLVPVGDAYYVDPEPTQLGEHPLTELGLGPRCEIVATTVPAAVGLSSALPASAVIGDPGPISTGRPGLAGLVVLGKDLDDRAPLALRDAWDHSLRALGVRAEALVSPSPDALRTAFAATCKAAGRGVAVVVFAGPGTPAGGGAFVLDQNALGHIDVVESVQAACSDVGLLVIVLDTSYVPRFATTGTKPPTLLWTASDAFAPQAARLTAHGPPALSITLASVVEERAKRCAGPGDRPSEPELLAWLFREDDIRARLLEARWLTLGLPALAALAADGKLSPARQEAVAAALASELPRTLTLASTTVPTTTRCTSDGECDKLAGLCALDDVCHTFGCRSGVCAPTPAPGRPCDDSVACTVDDRCDDAGRCVGIERACDDGNPCTDDVCEPAGCAFSAALDRPCDDGDACTDGDVCDGDGVCAGVARVCDDGDPCTRDSCDPEVADAPCVATPAPLPCDDGNPCTFSDQCRDRVCLGTARACADDNPCTADVCDPATGACTFAPLADGAPCDDHDACTALDRCAAGFCRGLARACDDGLACTFDACDAGVCTHLPTPGTCLSALGCIAVGERPVENPCQACVATDRLEPVLDGQPCAEDGIICTRDICLAGRCEHRDSADACHDMDGRCVATGERVTDCLVCVGGGVVVAEAAGTPCGAPDECAHGACDEFGNCDLPNPFPCCPQQVVTSGETIVLAAPNLEGATRVDAWSCLAGLTLGPERHVRVVASCTGTLAVSVSPTDAVLMVDAAPCPGTACTAAVTAFERPVVVGQTVDLAIEAPAQDGVWVLTTRCDPGELP